MVIFWCSSTPFFGAHQPPFLVLTKKKHLNLMISKIFLLIIGNRFDLHCAVQKKNGYNITNFNLL